MASFTHSESCPGAVSFLSKLLESQGPQSLSSVYQQAKLKGAAATVMCGAIDNTKAFITNHELYFKYDTEMDRITPSAETMIVWPFQAEMQAIEYFKKKMEKHIEIPLKNLGSHFGQAPDEVLQYLSMGGKPNRQDKIMGLVLKNVSSFIICGAQVKMVKMDQAEADPEPINLRGVYCDPRVQPENGAKEKKRTTTQRHGGKDPSTFEHKAECAAAVGHVRALLDVTGEQSVDSLLIILDTASPPIKHVIGSSKRALRAFAVSHGQYFKFNQNKKSITNTVFTYSWPPSLENSAVVYLKQRLSKHSSLEVDCLKDHFAQAAEPVKQFLAGGGGNQTAKLCAMIVKHTSSFIICGNDVKLAGSVSDKETKAQAKKGGPKRPSMERESKMKYEETQSAQSKDFNHSEKCRDGIRFLLKLLSEEGPKQPSELAFKVRQSEVTDAFPEHKGFIKVFTENHPHYFAYNSKENKMTVKPLLIKWRPGNIRNIALAFLRQKLMKLKKLHVNSLGSVFHHGPPNVKAVLSKMKGNPNEKIICLIRSCMDTFVICEDNIRLTTAGSVTPLLDLPAQPSSRQTTEQPGQAVRFGISGNITGKLHANFAIISCNIDGDTQSVFFEKKAYIGSVTDPKLPLDEILVSGERVCFDAVLGPPGASCKYKATRVWKAEIQGQASVTDSKPPQFDTLSPLSFVDATGISASKESTNKQGDSASSVDEEDLIKLDFMPETGDYFDEVMTLAGLDSYEFPVEQNLSCNEMLLPEKKSQDTGLDLSYSLPDKGKLASMESSYSYSSGASSLSPIDPGFDYSDESSEEEVNLGIEIGSALVDTTSKIIKKYQKSRSTTMSDLQAGITMCINHLNAVSAVLKSVDK